MVQAGDMWLFVGILTLAHKERGSGFNDLMDMLKATPAIPHAFEKLSVKKQSQTDVDRILCVSLFHFVSIFLTNSDVFSPHIFVLY